MEFQLMIGMLDVRDAALRFEMYAAWARFPGIILISNMLENQTSAKKHSSIKQLYWLDIKHVRLVSNRRVRSVLGTNQPCFFKFPASVPFDSFCAINFFVARFVEGLARWLFIRGTFRRNFISADVVGLEEGRVSTYNNEVLV